MQLSGGTHFMQVSKWLGHSSYVLTLSTYADYIREDDTAAPKLVRPVAASSQRSQPVIARVVPLKQKAQ
jgi:integrase